MTRRFTEFAFTPAVRDFQEAWGTRAANAKLEQDAVDARDRLGPEEAAFLARRDGFYMATVGETGWPYVQYRGGPAGFLKVLDEQTLGFADFRGNLQYISTGNLSGDGRVMLFVIDYPNRRRLKLWGRAVAVPAGEDPALAESLAMPGYPARVERAILIRLAAFDWNCQQHITPRYSEAEVQKIVAALIARVQELESALAAANPETVPATDPA